MKKDSILMFLVVKMGNEPNGIGRENVTGLLKGF